PPSGRCDRLRWAHLKSFRLRSFWEWRQRAPAVESKFLSSFCSISCRGFPSSRLRIARLSARQAPGGLVPGEIHAPGFDDACFLTTRLRRVHCHSSFGHSPAQGPALSFWSNAHHHAFWTQQLGVV